MAVAVLAAAANLSGAFHHAFPAHVEGFRLFNDVAGGYARDPDDTAAIHAATIAEAVRLAG